LAQPETNLAIIAALAEEREDENYDFRTFLKGHNCDEVDAIVHKLNDEISREIDCTQCGNCCKSLMVSILPEERHFFGEHFRMDQQAAAKKYLAEGTAGDTIMSNMPCVFLSENKCTVYENRFSDCREFPHLHKDNFTGRLFSVIGNYGMCPIIFNVMEALKEETGFIRER
jgi:hypothetical protein